MYYVGIDLGGTNIAAGIVDENGTIVKKGSMPTGRTRDAEEIIHDMCGLVKDLMIQVGITEGDVHSIGIGSPGTPDRENGVILYANNLKFRNVPMRDLIQKAY
jgi:glucokinase